MDGIETVSSGENPGSRAGAKKPWTKPEAEMVEARTAELGPGPGGDGPFNCHS